MDVSSYIDQEQDVQLSYESGKLTLRTYDANQGWTTYEVDARKIENFMKVMAFARIGE